MSDIFVSCMIQMAVFLSAGLIIGSIFRDQFSIKWLFVAVAMVFVNNFALTNGFHLLPNLAPSLNWNWQGKLFALLCTIAIAAHPAIGWRHSGFTWVQHAEGQRLTYSVAFVICVVLSFASAMIANDSFDLEALAFQLTMPGFEEETFYRGVLLVALNEAFKVKRNFLGIPVGYGAVLSILLFALVHALSYDDGRVVFSLESIFASSLMGFILLWFRERTGSLVLPVFMHNFTNSIPILV